ncbi:MAG: efflux RND transporter periplasmic adaptor subunit [Cyanobacteria bacterium P01_A01_bin.123]
MRSNFSLILPSKLTWPKKLSLNRNKWLRFVVPVLLLLGLRFGMTLITGGRSSQTEVLTQSVERKTVPVVITANGTVDPAQSINLSPKNSGVIENLLVEEGDRVEKDQVIAMMDDSNLSGELLQMEGQLAQQNANLDRLIAGDRPEDIAKAEAQLAEAEANLQEMQSGNRAQDIAQASARLQQAEATLQQRATDLQRYERLYSEGAISREELDQKRTDRDVADAQVIEAEEALALQNAGTRSEQIEQSAARVEQQRQTVAALRAGTRSEDIEQARAQVRSAEGSLQTVEAQLNDTRVVAPFDGIITQIYAEVGSFVSPSMAGGGSESDSSSSILLLSSARNQVVVNLPESQIARVEPGQSVVFKADAFPGEEFTGRVELIAAQATVSQNVTSFEVRVSIDLPAAEKLKIGMNVEAEFEVDSLDNALLVPNAAVVRRPDGEGVYILGHDREPVFQAIETGATAGGQTEVKSGLEGDEQVLISPPSTEAQEERGFNFPPAPE